ncbi:UPF0481 protein At3g47200-like [Corylus avellana]|uniref:UPF0481 protein At3g47200-like n=1 Tax=Corylus avellana TaxID=13451 RepID=UPI00286A5E4F|nr:UPF0481 protein At3g47200-like [Corylus avellana]
MGEPVSAEIQQIANASIKDEYQRANLVNDITKEVESLKPLSSPECCIYKVPDPLRKLNEEAYTPQVISIGPFHHGNQKLQIMEKYKVRYLKEFMERVKINLENLVCTIEDSEESVRQCYAEVIPLSRYDFLKMILMDASFIVELFVRNWRGGSAWTRDDRKVLKPWLAARMVLDFMLLENQLPFFIIEKLFELASASRRDLPSFTELTFRYFEFYNIQNFSPNLEPKIMHFVDLLRKFYLPHPQSLPRRKSQIVEHMYGATQLSEVGLKFEVNRSSKCLLDLHYEKGVLKIPRFTLDNCTELYARNLMAFEQCHYPNDSYVTDYFLMLHFLIQSEKDVGLLGRKGIMVNGLGNNDATFINSLGTSIVYSTMSSNYYDICNKLKEFYEDPSHGWLASLRRDYLRTPWLVASTTAAVTLLILTFVQAVCSILQVK